MRSRPVRQHLWLLVAVLCSITLIITAVSLISIHAEDIVIIDLTTVVGPAYDLNSGIIQTMTNAETGLRGYLATGDPVLLEPYAGAEQHEHTAQSQLRALLASPRISAADQRHYAQLQATQDAAIASWWRYAVDARAAVAFNVLTAANTDLAGAQAAVQPMQQVAIDVGRAIRVTSGVQEAMDVACSRLGPALQARRVMVTTMDEPRKITAEAQWHAPGLHDLTSVTKEMASHVARIANELWTSGGAAVMYTP